MNGWMNERMNEWINEWMNTIPSSSSSSCIVAGWKADEGYLDQSIGLCITLDFLWACSSGWATLWTALTRSYGRE